MLRFAPSPMKEMQLSDLRVAVINYLIAQQQKDRFVVRIDDGSAPENMQGKDTEVMMILEKFALKHDGVHHQSEHRGIHQTLAIRLLQEDKAFICQCDASLDCCVGECERLERPEYAKLKEQGDPFVVRIKAPMEDIVFEDRFFGQQVGAVETLAFVILDQAGSPSSTFATACEDMLGNIDKIIQKKQYLPETPKQIHIKNSLGYQTDTSYAHLSEVHQDCSVRSLLEQGFIPDAILNYLLCLGNQALNQEIFTLPQAVEWFDLDALSSSPAQVEMNVLREINRAHLLRMDDRDLSTLFGFADADIGKLAKCYLDDEVSTTVALAERIEPIFRPKSFDGVQGEVKRLLSDLIFKAPYFEQFDALLAYLIQESGLDQDQIETPLRSLLTGSDQSAPALQEIYPYIKSYLLEVAS